MSLQYVIELNNRVVSLLESHQFHEATQLSGFALAAFQRISGTAACFLHVENGQNSIDKTIDDCMKENEVDGADLVSSPDYIYSKGILLPSLAEEQSILTIPVLSFNTALPHHL